MSAENPTHEVKKEHDAEEHVEDKHDDAVPLEKIPSGLKPDIEELKICGYDNWLGDNPEEWQMKKALAVAVNKAIQEKIKPVDEKSGQVSEELYDLLARGNETKKSPREYFRKKVNLLEEITSPRVLVEKFLKSEAPQWLVENVIQRQFDIKWDTPTGEPDDYSFYEFCDTEKTKKFFKYIPRRAHVKATLYKEYCSNPKQYKKIRHDALRSPKKVLCPIVYFSTINGWKAWQAYDEEHDKEDVFREVNSSHEFEWIDKDILQFIDEYADKQTPDDVSLENGKTHPLEKSTLHWAVIEDSDFPRDEDEMKNLKLKPIGKTQVYVGRAKNGIKGRWINDGGSHCTMIKRCLDNVWAMTTYDPLRLEGIQLVDARLALAKVRGEKAALFVIKTFGDDLEKADFAVLEAKASLREAEEKVQKAQNASSPGSLPTNECLKADVEQRKAELTRANDAVLELKKISESQLKDKGINQLIEAKGLHLKGERKPGENIIPNLTMTWKPTDMAFGMNFGS